MKILYFDCFSGISGDMTIGALLDAGGDFSYLKEELKKLSFDDEYTLEVQKVIKNGITATKFDVVLKHDNRPHTHEQHSEKGDQLNGHGHAHIHENEQTDYHGHGHHHHEEHSHDNHGHGHHHHEEHSHHHHGHSHHHHGGQAHHHRSYQDIVRMINGSDLSEKAKQMSLAIFKKIGESEGRIHGLPLEEVHFHEVGAVDSIIDIVGTAILLDQLGVDKIVSAPVPVGSGRIHIAHGIYPVPAPATLDILKGIPIEHTDVRGELTTPTGAGIVAVLAETFGTLPAMKVTDIGYGAGTKTFADRPNVLRVVIGEQDGQE